MPDRSLPWFNRFYSTDPRFPLSLSYPQELRVNFDRSQAKGLCVAFGSDPDQFAVIRGDFTQEGYVFTRRADLYRRIQRDMDELVSRSTFYSQTERGIQRPDLTHLAAIKYWIEWPGERNLFFKKRGRKPEHQGPALIGELGTEVPRAVYLDPEHRYGERIYFLCDSDLPSILWTLWRQPGGTLREDTFRIILRSVRWLSDEFFRLYT